MFKEMEKHCTKQAELDNFRSLIDGKINQLNKSVIADAKQWQKHFKDMEKDFTAIAEITDFKSEIFGQINEFNKSMFDIV